MDTEKTQIIKAQRGNQEAIQDLFEKNKDLLDYKANAFSRAPIPNAAVKAEAYKIFMIALRRYDINSGIKFRTFLESHLRLNRYVTQNSSVVRLPENRVLEITRYRTTKASLESMLGREPSPAEMAAHLGWRLAQAEKMERSLSRSILSEAESSERKFSISTDMSSRYTDTIELLYYSLSGEERDVWDFANGAHGKPKLKAEQIAEKLRLSVDKVYRILRDVNKRIHGRL